MPDSLNIQGGWGELCWDFVNKNPKPADWSRVIIKMEVVVMRGNIISLRC